MPFLGMSGMSIERDSVYPAPVLGQLSVSPVAAYSLRRLSASATRAIQVRRSSDNTTLDISFVGSDLDVASLMAFVGANNGFVTAWYDQVGSNNATQATALLQPQIVSSGSLITRNGKPTLNFNTKYLFFASTITATATSTGNAVAQKLVNLTDMMIFTNTSNSQYMRINDTQNPIVFYGDTVPFSASTVNMSNLTVLTFKRNSATSTVPYANGTVYATLTTGGALGLGVNSLGIIVFPRIPGFLSEAIWFNSAISNSDQNVLERNQGGYYAISVA
jgi:hypothetical protein